MKNLKIAIIGCGNLGLSIVNGLLETEGFEAKNLMVTKRHPENLSHLQSLGVTVTADNKSAAKAADLVILGVKPYNIPHILKEIAPVVSPDKQTIISLATGVTLEEMYQHLPSTTALYRAMPNIAADIQESITCICGQNSTPENEDIIKALFNSIGISIIIEEHLMEAATVLGACGIAYVLRFMRAMTQGGIQIGFDAKTANTIVNQTVKGAAELLIKKGIHPEAAIDKVTTPKGCTIVGLNEMEHHGFSAAMVKGVLASYEKIEK
ncbi:pyrroline-5-carboxylate reductase [Echinicola vietnamensis]|uniref:Pyrroline-5-carboxylate reductase n=1 Tax=Echinicola vietnamensis (strain DSM 17526 / LMG 23754 / KMM 6221) TaxID=926556 RepID=L0G132_ECHVK|nr:pyrroline-5-carboxylate reductase [Echinicola vietnamensis]AGA78726.1 pyrroline-5-carboxylate reductase [Echinicola vietnamensis DSM 17526]